MEQNPYAAPQSQVLQSTTSDEAIRKEHINTEATIKSVGVLYYLGRCCSRLLASSRSAKASKSRTQRNGALASPLY
jgi:hypothetical protein